MTSEQIKTIGPTKLTHIWEECGRLAACALLADLPF